MWRSRSLREDWPENTPQNHLTLVMPPRPQDGSVETLKRPSPSSQGDKSMCFRPPGLAKPEPCPECGTPRDPMVVCPQCGFTPEMPCPKCGTLNRITNEACTNCGFKAPKMPPPPGQAGGLKPPPPPGQPGGVAPKAPPSAPPSAPPKAPPSAPPKAAPPAAEKD